MNAKPIVIALAISTTVAALPLSGCAVTREQQTVGQYIDDATITTRVKARFAGSTDVDPAAVSVETMKGVVLLSGFAKNTTEKYRAEQIARGVEGVTEVQNAIVVR